MENKTLKKEISIEQLLSYLKTENLDRCKNCKHFNQNYSCSIHNFDVKEFLNEYSSIIIYGKKFYCDDSLKSLKFSSDILNHFIEEYSYSFIKEVNENLLKLEGIIKDSNALIVGPCTVCDRCARLDNEICYHPDLAHYSFESLSMDINKLVKDLFDEEYVFTNNNMINDYFIFIGGILKNK